MIGLVTASKEASWLQRSILTILIHCDNTAAIAKVQKNLITMARDNRYVVSTVPLESFSLLVQ